MKRVAAVLAAVLLLTGVAAAQSEQNGMFDGFLDNLSNLFDDFNPFDGPGPGVNPGDNDTAENRSNTTNRSNMTDGNDTGTVPPIIPPEDGGNVSPPDRNDTPDERLGDGPAESAPVPITKAEVEDRVEDPRITVEPRGEDTFRVALYWGEKTQGVWNLNITHAQYVRQGNDEEIAVYSDWVRPVPGTCQPGREQVISYPSDAVIVNASTVENYTNGSITADDVSIYGRDGPSDYALCDRDALDPGPGDNRSNDTQPGNNTTAVISDRLVSLIDEHGEEFEYSVWMELADDADNETVEQQLRELGAEDVEIHRDATAWATPDEIREIAWLGPVTRIRPEEFECVTEYPHSKFCIGEPYRYTDAEQVGADTSRELIDLVAEHIGEDGTTYEYRVQLAVQEDIEIDRVAEMVGETGARELSIQRDNHTIIAWGTLDTLSEIVEIDYLTAMDAYYRDCPEEDETCIASPVRQLEEEEERGFEQNETNTTDSLSNDTVTNTSVNDSTSEPAINVTSNTTEDTVTETNAS